MLSNLLARAALRVSSVRVIRTPTCKFVSFYTSTLFYLNQISISENFLAASSGFCYFPECNRICEHEICSTTHSRPDLRSNESGSVIFTHTVHLTFDL